LVFWRLTEVPRRSFRFGWVEKTVWLILRTK
jgi:hypothetical protein